MSDKKLYLIDATAFCYRAFYAIKNLSTSFGQPTNAVYGFLKMLNKVLKNEDLGFLAVCFDVSRQTFRQKKFAEYKIHRPPMPGELLSQIPLIKEILAAYSITVFEKEGYEADDVIASLVQRAKQNKLGVTIVSSDKDILQLVDKDIRVFSPYKDEGVFYDEKKVSQRFGVAPAQIVDIISLMGDDADNIPGVAGIGEKTAAALIKKFGSLDKLLENTDKIIPEKIRKSVASSIEKIKLNRELAELDKGIEIEFNLDKLKPGQPDFKELLRLFRYLEFKAFLKELPDSQEGLESPEVKELRDSAVKDLFSRPDEEMAIAGEDFQNLWLGAGNKFFRVKNPGSGLKTVLARRELKKIGHDLKKIKTRLAAEGVDLGGLYFDTMIAAYLINPSRGGYALGELAWEYLDSKAGLRPTDGGQTLALVNRLKDKLEKELNNKSLAGLFNNIEMPLIEVLSDMELTGIRLDTLLLARLSRELEKRLAGLVGDIYRIGGFKFNINSPKQLREVLFTRLKLPVVKKTKTGPSTDEEVLNKLAGEHELPAFLLEYRQLTKLKSTYIDALAALADPKTGRVHTSFNQTATETGRLSSSQPNLQNMPVKTELGKSIRQAVIALHPDSYLLSCDYSQIELRVLAHLSQDENLISAFKKNEDVHKTTASLIYGLKQQEVTDKMRDNSKRVNFGIIYGLTSYGLSRDLGISNEDAQGFIEAYFLRYPKVREYTQEQIGKAEKEGFVSTILGRRRYLPEINNKNLAIRQFAQRQAINTPIQGSASDLIKLAMIQIHRLLREKDLKSKMILQIHDELLFDVPEEELPKAVRLIRERMENVLRLKVPIKVDIKIGKNWSEMKEVVNEDSDLRK